MPLGTYDDPFVIKQGEPLVVLCEVRNEQALVDLTAYTGETQMRRSLAADQVAPVAEGVVTVLEVDGGSVERGRVQITFGASETVYPRIPPGTYVFDALLTTDNEDEGIALPGDSVYHVRVEGIVTR